MLACLGDVRSGPKIPLQMVHTNIEQEIFRCSWCWNGAAFHRWLNLHQVNWIHSFWIHHRTSRMFPSVGVVSCQAITLFQTEWIPNISLGTFSRRCSEKIQGYIYIYNIIFLQNSLKKKSLCVFFPLPMFEKKTKRWIQVQTSKRRNVSNGEGKYWRCENGITSLTGVPILSHQQRGGELWRVFEHVFSKLGKPFEDFAAR